MRTLTPQLYRRDSYDARQERQDVELITHEILAANNLVLIQIHAKLARDPGGLRAVDVLVARLGLRPRPKPTPSARLLYCPLNDSETAATTLPALPVSPGIMLAPTLGQLLVSSSPTGDRDVPHVAVSARRLARGFVTMARGGDSNLAMVYAMDQVVFPLDETLWRVVNDEPLAE